MFVRCAEVHLSAAAQNESKRNETRKIGATFNLHLPRALLIETRRIDSRPALGNEIGPHRDRESGYRANVVTGVGSERLDRVAMIRQSIYKCIHSCIYIYIYVCTRYFIGC